MIRSALRASRCLSLNVLFLMMRSVRMTLKIIGVEAVIEGEDQNESNQITRKGG